MPFVHHTPSLQAVVAVIIDTKSHKVLISKRPYPKPFHGHWEFPGGKIEPLESPPEALVREIFEEVGGHVDPKTPQYLGSYVNTFQDNYKVSLGVYLVSQWTGRLWHKENQTLRWISFQDPLPSPTLPGMQDMRMRGLQVFSNQF